jgi:hypothetical protein
VGEWFRGYAAHLATYGGAVAFLLFLFGLYDDAVAYLETSQWQAGIALVLDAAIFSLTRMIRREEKEIEEYRKKVLSDIDSNDDSNR